MLKAEDLNLYYGASHALRDVSLTAEAGKITCVLGRNGVGKTSLMRALVGLQGVRSGAILWEGEDIVGLKPHERARRGIAMVPQGREIFPRLTVYENLETGLAPLPRSERSIDDELGRAVSGDIALNITSYTAMIVFVTLAEPTSRSLTVLSSLPVASVVPSGLNETDRIQSLWPVSCLLYTSQSPRDYAASRMPSSA